MYWALLHSRSKMKLSRPLILSINKAESLLRSEFDSIVPKTHKKMSRWLVDWYNCSIPLLNLNLNGTSQLQLSLGLLMFITEFYIVGCQIEDVQILLNVDEEEFSTIFAKIVKKTMKSKQDYDEILEEHSETILQIFEKTLSSLFIKIVKSLKLEHLEPFISSIFTGLDCIMKKV